MREDQILVERLIEEELAKSMGNPDHRMIITSKGRSIAKNGGYLKSINTDKAESDFYSVSEKFTKSEREVINERLDELFAKLEKFEMGQQIIYDDIIEEIE